MLRAAATLGEELGLTVVAEGVETAASLAIVREAGCHVAQGYLYAAPLPVAEFERSPSSSVGRTRTSSSACLTSPPSGGSVVPLRR